MTIGLNSSVPAAQSVARSTLSRSTLICAFASLLAFAAHDADARPGGGGGLRSGAGVSRGGSFAGLRSGSGLQRPKGSRQMPGATSGQRPNGSGTLGHGSRSATANSGTAGSGKGNSANRANVQNQSGNTAVTGNGNTRTAGNGNGSGNTGVVNNGTVNNGNVGSGNVNTGNVVAGNDVDVNVENGGWYGNGTGAAYATGVAVGATTTAVAVGSSYYALPSSACYPYAWHGSSYYSCAGTWYQQRYVSGSVTYVVVTDPTKTK